MQAINFGRIDGLPVVEGEPQFDSSVRVSREIKFGGENGVRPELGRHDFEVKSQVRDLMKHMDRLNTGRIALIEVKNGLPFRMVIEETLGA
jgi:hypothetical protein